MSVISRLRQAWAALRGDVLLLDVGLSDLATEARGNLQFLIRASHLTELPMALTDELTKLDAVFSAALAAAHGDSAALATANQTVADLTGQLATANSTIADLNSQLDQATAAVQALEAKYGA